jgi:hypothetical protein
LVLVAHLDDISVHSDIPTVSGKHKKENEEEKMKDITKDVQALLEGLKAVTGQIDSLLRRCDKLARTQAGKKQEARANPKPSPK